MFKRLIALLVLVVAVSAAQPKVFDCSAIPASQKPPFVEAPAECGGGCYWVGPFNRRPWAAKCTDDQQPINLPDGFAAVYGDPPKASDFGNYRDFQAARDKYAQDLKFFKGIGLPAGVSAAEVAASATYIAAFGIGKPIVFEGRYGFVARFEGSKVVDFEQPFVTVKESPGNVVVSYQMALFDAGSPVPCSQKHDWTPPQFCAKEGE